MCRNLLTALIRTDHFVSDMVLSETRKYFSLNLPSPWTAAKETVHLLNSTKVRYRLFA